jgi:hypothetical protein
VNGSIFRIRIFVGVLEEVLPFVLEREEVLIELGLDEELELFPIRKADFQRITYSRKLALVEFATPAQDHTIRNLPRSDGERIRGQMIPVLKK